MNNHTFLKPCLLCLILLLFSKNTALIVIESCKSLLSERDWSKRAGFSCWTITRHAWRDTCSTKLESKVTVGKIKVSFQLDVSHNLASDLCSWQVSEYWMESCYTPEQQWNKVCSNGDRNQIRTKMWWQNSTAITH